MSINSDFKVPLYRIYFQCGIKIYIFHQHWAILNKTSKYKRIVDFWILRSEMLRMSNSEIAFSHSFKRLFTLVKTDNRTKV